MEIPIHLLTKIVVTGYVLVKLYRSLLYASRHFWEGIFARASTGKSTGRGVPPEATPSGGKRMQAKEESKKPERTVERTEQEKSEKNPPPRRAEKGMKKYDARSAEGRPAAPQTAGEAGRPSAAGQDEFPDIMGKTRSVYLEAPVEAQKPGEDEGENPEPVRSEPLKPVEYREIGEVTADDVPMDPPRQERPDDSELYAPEEYGVPLDAEFCAGLTYDDMVNAANVLTAATDDDEAAVRAARTIYDLRQTDVFRFLTSEQSNAELVSRLFRECLDEKGMPRQRRQRHNAAADFDWEKII